MTGHPSLPRNEGAVTVYYDGACPLCRAEIAQYRKMGGPVDYADVSADGVPQDLTRQEALARFHVRGDDGTLYSGFAAFAALWRALGRERPWLRPVAALASTRPVLFLGERAYRLFLPVRPHLQRFLKRRQEKTS